MCHVYNLKRDESIRSPDAKPSEASGDQRIFTVPPHGDRVVGAALELLVARPFQNFIRPYMLWSGLFQAWDMFAPNPMKLNSYVEAEVSFRDGSRRIWSFPRMNEIGYVDRYFKERYRKFANEYLRMDVHSALWPDAARYIAPRQSQPVEPARRRASDPLVVGDQSSRTRRGVPLYAMEELHLFHLPAEAGRPGMSVRSLIRAWNEFFFEPRSPTPICLFRVLLDYWRWPT